MSLQKCKKCDLTKHISDYASSGSCPVDGGNHEFEFYNNSPFLKVSSLSPETLEQIRLENEKHYGPGRGSDTERRLIDLEKRVKALEKDNNARGMSGMHIG